LDDCHQIFLQNGNTARFTKYSTESVSALTNGEEKTGSIISKMLLNLSCTIANAAFFLFVIYQEQAINLCIKNNGVFETYLSY
jgi:hypothetical protein